MRVVIIGGGIAAAYVANNLKKHDTAIEVVMLSDEKHPPYDRIHLCRLVDGEADLDAIKLPLERRRDLIGQFFVQRQSKANGVQVGKVIRCQHLTLDDREVDFDLIQPTGMDRSMDQNDPTIDLTQPLLRRFAPM